MHFFCHKPFVDLLAEMDVEVSIEGQRVGIRGADDPQAHCQISDRDNRRAAVLHVALRLDGDGTRRCQREEDEGNGAKWDGGFHREKINYGEMER